MSVIPHRKLEQIQWMEERLSAWAASAANIGLTDQQASDIEELTGTARAAYNLAQTKRQQAQNATAVSDEALEAMRTLAGLLVSTIRAFARTSENPAQVFDIAMIPPPKTPSPAPPPEMPWDIVTTVENDGSITLKWRGKNAAAHAGTAFEIGRKLAGQNAYTLAGTVGEKTFNDQGVPPGITSVSYRIRARRGDKVSGYSEPVTVYFGVAPEDGGEGGDELQIAA